MINTNFASLKEEFEEEVKKIFTSLNIHTLFSLGVNMGNDMSSRWSSWDVEVELSSSGIGILVVIATYCS